MSKSASKQTQIIDLIKDLRTEIKELNGAITANYQKIKEKEAENNILIENITEIKNFYSQSQENKCVCCIC